MQSDMAETAAQQECSYCHDDNNSVEITEGFMGTTHRLKCSGEELLTFTAYPGDFHVGAVVYISSKGMILMDTGDPLYNDYLPVDFCPVCGRKLGADNE